MCVQIKVKISPKKRMRNELVAKDEREKESRKNENEMQKKTIKYFTNIINMWRPESCILSSSLRVRDAQQFLHVLLSSAVESIIGNNSRYIIIFIFILSL